LAHWILDLTTTNALPLQIIDTGVDQDYRYSSQLNLVGGANFISGSSKGTYSWNDCNGHGTHVAGTGRFSRPDTNLATQASTAWLSNLSFDLHLLQLAALTTESLQELESGRSEC
jgi:hypothetical protein